MPERGTPVPHTAANAQVHVDGDGPPLIYVPGMDGTGQLFYRQGPALARRFRVITFRLRDDARTMDELVQDLHDLLDAVVPDGTPAILMGESFGGALSMSFALRHPSRVRALVILNSFPWFAPQFRLRLAHLGITLMPWQAMRLIRRLTAFRLQSPHTPRADMHRFLRLTAGTTRRGYLNRLAMLREYDVRERLRDLHRPTLFLAADRDHLIPSVSQARFMCERVPNSDMRILAGHGHACLVAPDVNLDAILDEWTAWRDAPAGAAPDVPTP